MSNLRPDPAALPAVRHVSVVNLANALTVLRLALIPVFAVLLLHGNGHEDGWRIGAAVVFALAVITDKYDGDIARSRGLITDFGKLADPIADKALIGAAMIGLSILGDLPWWVTVVIMVREVGVTMLRFWVIRHGVIAASRGGKAKTLAQALAIWMYVLPLSGVLASARWWLMGVAILLTIITGLDYVARAVRLRRVKPALAALAAAATARAADKASAADPAASANAAEVTPEDGTRPQTPVTGPRLGSRRSSAGSTRVTSMDITAAGKGEHPVPAAAPVQAAASPEPTASPGTPTQVQTAVPGATRTGDTEPR